MVVVDLLLGLAAIYRMWYISMPVGDYLWFAWDKISLWAGRGVTIVGVLVPIVAYLLRGRVPPAQSRRKIFESLLHRFSTWRKRTAVIGCSIAVELLVAATLVMVIFSQHPQIGMPPSTVMLAPNGLEVYVITYDEKKNGEIRRYSTNAGKDLLGTIDIGGGPELSMLIGPRNHHIYILDIYHGLVTEVDPSSPANRKAVFLSGRIATSMAITPDGRKLYVSNQQPVPNAPISIVDLTSKEFPTKEIEGFNCPEFLTILPTKQKLYVVTQCGSGLDPVFIVDTKTDKKIGAIKGFAVGSRIVATSDGEKVYVVRSRNIALDENGNQIDEPARISVIDTKTDKMIKVDAYVGDVGALTVSPDGRYLFFSVGRTIKILNAETLATSSVAVGADASGIAVGYPSPGSSSLVLYAWLPNLNYLYLTGLDGLLP
jgi:WD40 repeat protein